jgi:hypothetical protein
LSCFVSEWITLENIWIESNEDFTNISASNLSFDDNGNEIYWISIEEKIEIRIFCFDIILKWFLILKDIKRRNVAKCRMRKK